MIVGGAFSDSELSKRESTNMWIVMLLDVGGIERRLPQTAREGIFQPTKSGRNRRKIRNTQGRWNPNGQKNDRSEFRGH